MQYIPKHFSLAILLHDQCPFVYSSHAHIHPTWLPGKNLRTRHICKYTEMAWNVHSMLQQTLECRKSSRFAPQRIIDLLEYISLETHLECINLQHILSLETFKRTFFLVAPSNPLMLQWAHVLAWWRWSRMYGKVSLWMGQQLIWSSIMTERESVGIWLHRLLMYICSFCAACSSGVSPVA